jgi:hypothetical protein
MSIIITTPVGRLVQGSLYKGNDTDANGSPLVVKTGPNVGQARTEFYFAVAIPKGQEQHWNQTEWGRQIWDEAAKSWPNGEYERPDFSWKIVDGDSQVPNKKNVKPCDVQGFAGHWVMKFSSGFAPQIFNADGSQQLVEEGAVKLGYYVQVNGSANSNGNAQNPGMYLNHSMVAFSAYGDEIRVGPDAASVGFGGQPLPAGASSAPTGGGSFNPAAPTPAAAAPAAAPVAAPAAAPVVAPVTPPPNPAILNAPGGAEPQLTAKAAGHTYQQLLEAGWTDDTLRQHGYLA